MGYDIETLRNINQRYCGHPHILTNSDVEMVNNWISKIQQERIGEPKVTPGDLVQLTTRYGDYYGRALVNSVEEDGRVYVCEQPYTPFVYVDSYGKVGMNASGGAWSHIPKGQMRYVGKGKRFFCDWGFCGPCADGAIDFEAEVNVWEYTEENPLYGDYTTKDYERYYVSFVQEEKDGSPYHYFVRDYGGTSHHAFRTEKEYLAWLRTYHGVEFKGMWPNQTVVFTYRKASHLITEVEWDELHLPIDVAECNGLIYVKVETDHEHHVVHEYRFTNDGNKLDWRTTMPRRLALADVESGEFQRHILPLVNEL